MDARGRVPQAAACESIVVGLSREGKKRGLLGAG